MESSAEETPPEQVSIQHIRNRIQGVTMNPSTRTSIILAIFLVVYLTAGIFTELEFIERKPLPERLVSDFRLYKTAYKQALEGESPYNDVFLYPPPSLLVVDFFSHLPNTLLQYAFYLTINIVLLICCSL